ncbi:FAD-dependent monooxygenase [Streptomyces sp. NPDC005526]|uniref:FAD-dependent monooxygenase n=1 Tax=Streptomyces sp. NPDC005526 TaxID=3156885 RepID=UPI0033A53224
MPHPDSSASLPDSRPAFTPDVDVLVVGAGPTGLTAAAEARRHGLRVRIVERRPSRSQFSKALVVHARTLEVFAAMGIADAVIAQGARFTALNAQIGGPRHHTRVDLLQQPWGDTDYPYWLSIPQYATEQILERHLVSLGVEVEWSTPLHTITDRGDHVDAIVERADGSTETIRSRWLIGCDGSRSPVRDQAGLRLDRTDAGATFVLADVKTTAALKQDEGHMFLGREQLLLIVPMPEPDRWRIIAHVPTPAGGPPLTVDAASLDDLIRRRAGIEFGSHDVVWQSQFDLSQGLVDHYRKGRVFLAGDAAHVHSPVGGQGLNTGVQEAHNLAWKLAAAERLEPGPASRLLDSYEAERRPVAQAMVKGTVRATRVLTTTNPVLHRAVRAVAPHVIARRRVQARLGRGVGMLDIGYPDSPLARTTTSRAAGRRLPNPRLALGGRLHDRLSRNGYTWIVTGRADEQAPDAAAAEWGDVRMVHLNHQDLAEPLHGLGRVTLVRPDGHVAATATTVGAIWAQLPVPARPLSLSRT